MQPLNLSDVVQFVEDNIGEFHERRLASLKRLKLSEVLKRKNPYLFKAKDINVAHDLVKLLLDAHLSSQEETIFGEFLEKLAIFVCGRVFNGRKSSAEGIDLEFTRGGVIYIVSIKSGPNWGNSSQQDKLEQDLKNAVARVKQSRRTANVQAVLGICYGKTKTTYLRGYMKIVGQNFWYLISGDKDLYKNIIEPVGYRAREHNENYYAERDKVINRFVLEFMQRFCAEDGAIDWPRLVQFNSGNFDLEKFISYPSEPL